MSAEAKLREALADACDPQGYRDVDGDGFGAGSADQILEEVLRVLKQGEWLITGGTVLGVQFAWPASGIFTDQEWVVRVAQG